MHLFRSSLTGKAESWLKSLPANSLTTWEEVTMTFLKKYFLKWKTADIRRKISSFEQENDETLAEAWELFKEMIRSYPHHEFNKHLLIRFHYDGLDPISRANLDAGAGGQHSKIPQEQLESTIEEVIKNTSSIVDSSCSCGILEC